MFKLHAPYAPSGDQPQAISELVKGIKEGKKEQVLLGATGTGKTFTIANVINNINKPTLVLAHNKTLAGQLYAELKEFFPENHVEYFVSYYDYYQPEAYVPSSDTYIEKDSSINDEIDELRHAATSALINYKDVIVVASVSCIYGIGEKEEYEKNMLILTVGDKISRNTILNRLIDMTYERNELDFHRGTFRVRGDNIDIIPVNEKVSGIRVTLEDDIVSYISIFDPLTGVVLNNKKSITISPASHFVTSKDKMDIFKTLMMNRLGWSVESVRALNIIDIVFADDESVRKAWNEYYQKLCVEQPTETQLKQIQQAQEPCGSPGPASVVSSRLQDHSPLRPSLDPGAACLPIPQGSFPELPASWPPVPGRFSPAGISQGGGSAHQRKVQHLLFQDHFQNQ